MKKRLRKDVDAHVWKIAMRHCLESKEYIRLSVRKGFALIGGSFPRSPRPADGSGASGSPFLESRFGVAQFHYSNILDLQSDFFMLLYSD